MLILMYGDLQVDDRNPDYMSFLDRTIEFLCEIIVTYKPDLVVNMGDLFQTKDTISVKSLVWAWEKMNKIGNLVGKESDHWIIKGNHDISDRDGKISSVQVMESYYNNVFIETSRVGDYVVIPYTENYEALRSSLKRMDFRGGVKAVFSHIGIIGCRLTPSFVSDKGMTQEDLLNLFPNSFVFNGHYHHPVDMGRLQIVGSPLHRDFNDILGDIDRGFLLWDSDTKKVTRIKNPNTYYNLSLQFEGEDQMKSTAEELRSQKDFVRVRISVPSSLVEETNEEFSGFLWKSVVPSDSVVSSIYQGSGLEVCSRPYDIIKKGVELAPDGLDKDLLQKMGKEVFS